MAKTVAGRLHLEWIDNLTECHWTFSCRWNVIMCSWLLVEHTNRIDFCLFVRQNETQKRKQKIIFCDSKGEFVKFVPKMSHYIGRVGPKIKSKFICKAESVFILFWLLKFDVVIRETYYVIVMISHPRWNVQIVIANTFCLFSQFNILFFIFSPNIRSLPKMALGN